MFLSAEEHLQQYYDYNKYKNEIREPYNWNIVWLAAKFHGLQRAEVLRFTVWDFVESVEFLFKEKAENIGR